MLIYTMMDKKESLATLKRMGVVGAGGAGFPTHVKLAAEVDTLVVNAAECEPLLECDRHLMSRRAGELVRACRRTMELAGAERCLIGLKEKHSDLAALLAEALERESGISLALLPDVYPMGEEQTLVRTVTGRVVPPGALPSAVGCVVDNVATVINVLRALEGRPVISRYVTVSGMVAKPITVEARIGTPLSKLLEAAGGTLPGAVLVKGGPMTGALIPDPEAEVVTKTTSAVLAIPAASPAVRERRKPLAMTLREARGACFQCMECTRLCPRWVNGAPFQPHLIMRRVSWIEDWEDLPADDPVLQSAHYCCDCGICSLYACRTMRLSPRMVCRTLKKKVPKPKPPAGAPQPADPVRHAVPTGALTRSILVEPLHTVFAGRLECDRLVIPLRQHIGAPAEPCVMKGARVREAQRIAVVPEGALGSDVHSPVDGRIVELDADSITIEREDGR